MCTSIAIGKNASRDGQIVFVRNEDFSNAHKSKAIIRRPEPEYVCVRSSVSSGSWILGNGLRVNIPEPRFAYTGMPDGEPKNDEDDTATMGDRFFFEERGVNEANFAIIATNSMTPNNNALAADKFVSTGIAECVLASLLVPQASSAADALTLLAGYLKEKGAAEANGLLLADPNEARPVNPGGMHCISNDQPAG